MKAIRWFMLMLGLVIAIPMIGAQRFDKYDFEAQDTTGKPVLIPGEMVPDTSQLFDSIAAAQGNNTDTTDFYDSLAAVTQRILSVDQEGVESLRDTVEEVEVTQDSLADSLAATQGRVTTLEALQLTDSTRIKANTDSVADLSGRTQGLSESGGTTTLENELKVIDTDTINVRDEIINNRGLSGNWEDFDFWNQVPLTGTDINGASWTTSSSTMADSTTNYKTDGRSYAWTFNAENDYAYLPLGISLAKFRDSTSLGTANYICWAARINTEELADLGASAGIRVCINEQGTPGGSNGLTYDLDATDFVADTWVYFQKAISEFNEVGTMTREDVGCIYLYCINANPDDETIILFDHFIVTRDSPSGPWPNAFQEQVTAGVWIDAWKQDETNNCFWLVMENGRLGAFGAEDGAETSTALCAYSFNDYTVSGSVKASLYGQIWGVGAGQRWYMNAATTLRYDDGTQYDFTTSNVNLAAGDMVYFEAERRDSVLTMRISESPSGPWDAAVAVASGAAYASDIAPRMTTYSHDHRIYDFGLSRVDYAARAGVADRLSNMGIEYDARAGIGTFMITVGDSTFFLAADSVTAAQ